MKLLVIGQSVVDIINYKGKEDIKPGGIHYTVLALNSFKSIKDEIFLCSTISSKDEYLFQNAYKNFNREYLNYTENIPTVRLAIHENKEREERYDHITKNLEIPQEDIASLDGILINMITGFDITLDQLKIIRKQNKNLIYFDVHTMSRDVDLQMRRLYKRIHNFKYWAENIDIIQANESELFTLSDRSNEMEIVDELFDSGVRVVIVTKGDKGVTAYIKNENRIEHAFIPAINANPVNNVGCGDVFGAVFFYNYISQRNVINSLKLANIAAGVSTEYSDIADYINLKKDVFKRFSEE